MGGLAPPNLPARALPLHSLKELLRHNIPFKPQVPASWANRWDYLIILRLPFHYFSFILRADCILVFGMQSVLVYCRLNQPPAITIHSLVFGRKTW